MAPMICGVISMRMPVADQRAAELHSIGADHRRPARARLLLLGRDRSTERGHIRLADVVPQQLIFSSSYAA